MIRIRVRYSGRVQGVGFRATVRRLAAAYAVTGWVRNEPDGTVTLEAQGERAEIVKLHHAIDQAMSGFIRTRTEEVVPTLATDHAFEIAR